MERAYRMTFDTKKGGDCSWVIDLTAENLKDAKAKAEERWNRRYKYYGNIPHMFHVHVRLLKPDEEFLYHWFKRIYD